MKKVLAILSAAAMTCGLFSGCGQKNAAVTMEDPNTVPEDTYEIQWYLMADAQNDVESVEAELNAYLKDKINATVNINCLPAAQYTSKLSTMIGSGEYFDMAFVAKWALDYIGNSRNGAYFDLTDYLDTYLKDVTGTIGKDNLKYSFVDGRIYAIPVYKEMASQYGWVYRKDIADKYNIDMTQYKSFEELEPVLKMIKENEPGMKYPIDWAYGNGSPNSLLWQSGFFYLDGKNDNKASNIYASDEYRKACEVARDFYNKGYVRPDVLTATDQYTRMSEGNTFVMLQPIKPGKAQELFKNSKYEFAQAEVTGVVKDLLAGTGSMQAISATSKNPARVMRFMNILNTDPYVKNLVVHGIEGKHYTKKDDKTVEIIAGSGYDLYTDSWSIGNVFLDYLLPNDDPEKHEKLKEYNERAVDYGLSGFMDKEVKDSDKKQRGIEISNAIGNYEKQLVVGAVDVEPTLKEFLSVLEKAGINDAVKDTQEAIDEFLSNNNK